MGSAFGVRPPWRGYALLSALLVPALARAQSAPDAGYVEDIEISGHYEAAVGHDPFAPSLIG